jgi:gas vesicle protein
MARENHAFEYLTIGISAAALGAIAGLMFAPASGRDTRKRWAKRLDTEQKVWRKKGQKAMDQFVEYASDRFEEGREKLHDLVAR